MKFLKLLVLVMAAGTLMTHHGRLAAAQSAVLACEADTALFEQNTNHNLGGMTFLPIGRTDLGKRARGLYLFSTAGLPSGAVIRSATLELEVVHHNLDTNRSFSIHRVLTGWGGGDKSGGLFGDESLGAPATTDEATWYWRNYPASSWGQPGGLAGIDYTSSPSVSEDVEGVGRYVFSSDALARDVQAWLDHPGTNFGWLVKIDNENVNGTALGFASREDTEGAGPALRVEFETAGPTSPRLINGRRNGGSFQFDFLADANRIYFTEYSSDLRVWTFLDLVPPGPSRTVTVTDPMGSEPRFYRITAP